MKNFDESDTPSEQFNILQLTRLEIWYWTEDEIQGKLKKKKSCKPLLIIELASCGFSLYLHT